MNIRANGAVTVAQVQSWSQLFSDNIADMTSLSEWFQINKLSLNLSKTNCALYRPNNTNNYTNS